MSSLHRFITLLFWGVAAWLCIFIIGMLAFNAIQARAATTVTVPKFTTEQQTAILQTEFDTAANYLRSVNLPVPNMPIVIDETDTDKYEKMGTRDAVAIAGHDYIVVDTNVAAFVTHRLWIERNQRGNYRPKILGQFYRRMFLHELLHYLQAVPLHRIHLTSPYLYNLYINGLEDEEGIVDAVAYDLVPGFIKYMYGAKALNNRFYSIVIDQSLFSSYSPLIERIRAASARIAGTPGWHNRFAFAVRIKLLTSTFDERNRILYG